MPSCLGMYVQNNLIKYAKISKEHNEFKVEAYGVKFFELNIEETIETIKTKRESPEEENEEDLSDISRNVLNREENEYNQPLDLDAETDISKEETNEDNLPNPSELGLDLTSPESFDEE